MTIKATGSKVFAQVRRCIAGRGPSLGRRTSNLLALRPPVARRRSHRRATQAADRAVWCKAGTGPKAKATRATTDATAKKK